MKKQNHNTVVLDFNGKTVKSKFDYNSIIKLDSLNYSGETSQDIIIQYKFSFWDKIMVLLGFRLLLHLVSTKIIFRKLFAPENDMNEKNFDTLINQTSNKEYHSLAILKSSILSDSAKDKINIGHDFSKISESSEIKQNLDNIFIISEVPHVCKSWRSPLIDFFVKRYNWKAFLVVLLVSFIGAMSRTQDPNIVTSLKIFGAIGIPMAFIFGLITSDFGKNKTKFNSHD